MEAKRKKAKPKGKKKTKARSKGLGTTAVAKSRAPRKSVSRAPAQQWFMPAAAPAQGGGSLAGILLATVAIGAAGYFGFQRFKKYKAGKTPDLDNELDRVQPTKETKLPPVIPNEPFPYTPPTDKGAHTGGSKRNDNFPLKKGSKGEMVRQMQQALIDKYGASILPKYGADGDFGSETVAALKKKGLPEVVTESAFNVITQSGSEGTADPNLARQLHQAASGKNFNGVLDLLKKIKSKEQYQQVSNSFMQMRLNGFRQTLVNGALSSFHDETQKQQIRMEFIRMGLQYRNNKFSLSGFDGRPLVTKAAAVVWVSPTESIQVPAQMVIGNEVTKKLDYTLFENNGKYYLIKTEAVKYL